MFGTGGQWFHLINNKQKLLQNMKVLLPEVITQALSEAFVLMFQANSTSNDISHLLEYQNGINKTDY